MHPARSTQQGITRQGPQATKPIRTALTRQFTVLNPFFLSMCAGERLVNAQCDSLLHHPSCWWSEYITRNPGGSQDIAGGLSFLQTRADGCRKRTKPETRRQVKSSVALVIMRQGDAVVDPDGSRSGNVDAETVRSRRRPGQNHQRLPDPSGVYKRVQPKLFGHFVFVLEVRHDTPMRSSSPNHRVPVRGRPDIALVVAAHGRRSAYKEAVGHGNEVG